MNTVSANRRLLIFDCHEAYVYQLRLLGQPMDVIVGLKGRHTSGWDYAMRPAPPDSRMIRLPEALSAAEPYDCIIAHNLSDLLDVKSLAGPRLLVIHETLEGNAIAQGSATPPEEIRRAVEQYLDLVGAHAIAVSPLKARSWGLANEGVPSTAEPADYPPYSGDLARGLRIANQIRRKARTLLWNFHEQAFSGVPLTLVGRNEDMPGVAPALDWTDLKEFLRRHRFFVHTADPSLEDGYNMATLEAMAAGLPVLGNRNPTSPIVHGISGFLSDDPAELRGYALRLLEDRDLAMRMGSEAQKTVAAKFSPIDFVGGMGAAIETARRKWIERRPRV
jgi:glycosyltransferase involved in cell wall biosynthesis